MANGTTIPRDDAGKLALIQHLSANLPHYAETLEISASDLAQLKAGVDWFELILKTSFCYPPFRRLANLSEKPRNVWIFGLDLNNDLLHYVR